MDKLNNDADVVNCEVRIKSFAVEEAAESKQTVGLISETSQVLMIRSDEESKKRG